MKAQMSKGPFGETRRLRKDLIPVGALKEHQMARKSEVTANATAEVTNENANATIVDTNEAVVTQPVIDPIATAMAKMSDAKLATISAKMRFLSANGLTRSQIAKALNKRYQHVKNVLDKPLKSQQVSTAANDAPKSEAAPEVKAA